MSEASAGSDVVSMKLRAEKKGRSCFKEVLYTSMNWNI